VSSVLLLGFVIGLQHALEADHVAAVSSLASGETGLRRIMRHGAVWGLGHTLALLGLGGAALLFKATIDGGLALGLEFCVGAMLTGLGAHVLYRLWRERVHFHTHRHFDGTTHFHAHSHQDERGPHGNHEHLHSRMPWQRTLLVGLMHGFAGSAALVVLTASSLGSTGPGLMFIMIFGLGSIIGMACLSAVIAVPLALTSKSLTRINGALQGTVGAVTIAIGLTVIGQSWAVFV